MDLINERNTQYNERLTLNDVDITNADSKWGNKE